MRMERFTTMSSLLEALAKALNLIDPTLENHHQQTAYLAYMMAREAGFRQEDLELTIYAAILHDIGFITCEESGSLQALEQKARFVAGTGARILEGLPGAEPVANIIAHCQTSWAEYLRLPEVVRETYREIARVSSVIHLADVVSTLIRPAEPILHQAETIRKTIVSLRGREFSEEAVDAFLSVSGREYVWMDIRYYPQFLKFFTGSIRDVSLDRAVELTGLMSRIIDYRSSFTAMHSAGVAATAEALARLCGMSADECKMMRIAGYSHDLGKLTTPRAILEKPGKLTDEEFDRIKEHPYYTRLILMDVGGFEQIANWAGFHHEKLNGGGYPFHFGAEVLDRGSRIMAVADIFSAITEVRPYRAGMAPEEVRRVLDANVASGGICGEIVGVLNDHYEEIDALREAAARSEGKRYYESIRGQ